MEIIKKKGFAVVGIKVEAKWSDLSRKMPKAWQQFRERLEEVSDRKNDIMMDISLNESGDVYTQLIGVEVGMKGDIPDDMTKIIIPPQKYIHFQHAGALSDIAESFRKMYEWAKENDIEAGTFKLDIGYRKDESEKVHDLYIRVV